MGIYRKILGKKMFATVLATIHSSVIVCNDQCSYMSLFLASSQARLVGSPTSIRSLGEPSRFGSPNGRSSLDSLFYEPEQLTSLVLMSRVIEQTLVGLNCHPYYSLYLFKPLLVRLKFLIKIK